MKPDEEPRTTRAGLLRKIARGPVNRLENRPGVTSPTTRRGDDPATGAGHFGENGFSDFGCVGASGRIVPLTHRIRN